MDIVDGNSNLNSINSFAYACPSSEKKQTRLFPFILSEMSELFSYQYSTFALDSDKQNTFRAFTYSLGIHNSITIQTSFWGYLSNGKIQDYNPVKLQKLGEDIVKSLFVYFSDQKKKYRKLLEQYQRNQQKNIKSGSFLYCKLQQHSDNDPQSDYIKELQDEIKLKANDQRRSQKKWVKKRYQKKMTLSRQSDYKVQSRVIPIKINQPKIKTSTQWNQIGKSLHTLEKRVETSKKKKTFKNERKKLYQGVKKIYHPRGSRAMSKQQLSMNVINLSAFSALRQTPQLKGQMNSSFHPISNFSQVPTLHKILLQMNLDARIKSSLKKRK